MHHTPLTMVGMHRSRAWIVAQLVAALVVYFGPDCELSPPQLARLLAYYEHNNAPKLNEQLFARGKCTRYVPFNWEKSTGLSFFRRIWAQNREPFEKASGKRY